jgi:hypothetical protein
MAHLNSAWRVSTAHPDMCGCIMADARTGCSHPRALPGAPTPAADGGHRHQMPQWHVHRHRSHCLDSGPSAAAIRGRRSQAPQCPLPSPETEGPTEKRLTALFQHTTRQNTHAPHARTKNKHNMPLGQINDRKWHSLPPGQVVPTEPRQSRHIRNNRHVLSRPPFRGMQNLRISLGLQTDICDENH